MCIFIEKPQVVPTLLMLYSGQELIIMISMHAPHIPVRTASLTTSVVGWYSQTGLCVRDNDDWPATMLPGSGWDGVGVGVNMGVG